MKLFFWSVCQTEKYFYLRFFKGLNIRISNENVSFITRCFFLNPHNIHQVLKLFVNSILRAMNEIQTISAEDTAQNTPSDGDSEQDFRRIIRHGNKSQVNKIPQSKICCATLFIYHSFALLTDLSCNFSGLFHRLLHPRIQIF